MDIEMYKLLFLQVPSMAILGYILLRFEKFHKDQTQMLIDYHSEQRKTTQEFHKGEIEMLIEFQKEQRDTFMQFIKERNTKRR